MENLEELVRIIDTTLKSRNEKLASLMRQFNLCEELGTGWDKIVLGCEFARIPPPRMQVYEHLTNGSFRERLGVPASSAGSVSRVIAEAVEKNLIRPLDPQAGNRYMKYMPYWA